METNPDQSFEKFEKKARSFNFKLWILFSINTFLSCLCWYLSGLFNNPLFTLYSFLWLAFAVALLLAFVGFFLVNALTHRTKKHWFCLLKTLKISGLFFLVNGLVFWFASPPACVCCGCFTRIMSQYRVDDLREFAREANASADSSDGDAIQVDAATTRKYSSLLNGGTVFRYENVIEVSWGGALIGHHGFAVAVNGKPLNTELLGAPVEKAIHVSRDVVFFDGY